MAADMEKMIEEISNMTRSGTFRTGQSIRG